MCTSHKHTVSKKVNIKARQLPSIFSVMVVYTLTHFLERMDDIRNILGSTQSFLHSESIRATCLVSWTQTMGQKKETVKPAVLLES